MPPYFEFSQEVSRKAKFVCLSGARDLDTTLHRAARICDLAWQALSPDRALELWFYRISLTPKKNLSRDLQMSDVKVAISFENKLLESEQKSSSKVIRKLKPIQIQYRGYYK